MVSSVVGIVCYGRWWSIDEIGRLFNYNYFWLHIKEATV